MIDDLKEFLNQANTLSPDKRTVALTMFAFWTVAQCFYYLVLGVAVIVIGRRIINAALTAWREIRREPS